jgi:putative ABC transport system substrate-binding protein
VRRRHLILSAGAWSALAWAGAARAQAPAKVRRIGLLSPWTPDVSAPWHQAFRLGLRDLGWVEGKNISIEYRYAEGRSDRHPDLAAEIVRLKVDVIVVSNTPFAVVAQKATKAIPIVLTSSGDPVAIELVDSLARPGGNVTGLSQMSPQLAGKRLELLTEIVPKLSRVVVLWNPQNPASTFTWKEIQVAARQLGIRLHSLEVRSPNDFVQVFEETTRARAGAIFIMPDPVMVTNLKRIADFAEKNRLPSIFHLKEFADAGGLVTYGVDRADMFRRAATFVDKILKGAKPGDLPVEQPTKFELVINLKTAKAIGITIPQSIMLQATRVIE